jgi:outer membrane lipoprotein-sorting protein
MFWTSDCAASCWTIIRLRGRLDFSPRQFGPIFSEREVEMFSRLKNAIFGLLLACPTGLAADPMQQASDWLKSFETLSARFEQITDDGERSFGTMTVWRPGKMRLEYDGKKAPLVIVGAGAVAIFDPHSNTGPTQYPLSKTPLGPILARNPDLAKSPMIDGILQVQDQIIITARDPEHPDYGSADFFFEGDPVRLTRWVMTSSSGDRTHLVLSQIETGVSLNSESFSAAREKERRNPGR